MNMFVFVCAPSYRVYEHFMRNKFDRMSFGPFKDAFVYIGPSEQDSWKMKGHVRNSLYVNLGISAWAHDVATERQFHEIRFV